MKSNRDFYDLDKRRIYYGIWAQLQRQDVCFFTYIEEVQNMFIVFSLIALTTGICKLLSKYDRQIKSTK